MVVFTLQQCEIDNSMFQLCRLVILMSKEEIAPERIFQPRHDVFSAVVNSSLLEDEYPSCLWLDVVVPILVPRDTCCPSLNAFVAEIYLDCHARHAAVWKIELTITVTSEVVTLSISQET